MTHTSTHLALPGTRRPPSVPSNPLPPDRAAVAVAVQQPVARDATRLVAAVGRWYWEVLDGHRDPRQLRHLLSPACERRVRAAAVARQRGAAARRAPITEVRRADLVWRGAVGEGLALVRRGPRTTAVTVTLERRRGRYRITDIARPEGPLAPLRPPRPPRR